MPGFAEKFKPIFRACDLAIFCKNPTETTELNFVAKYYPFKKHVHKRNVLSLANEKAKISERHVQLVQNEWQKHFKDGKTVSFNDEVLVQKLFADIDKKHQALVLALDEDDQPKAEAVVKKVQEPSVSFIVQNKPLQNQVPIVDAVKDEQQVVDQQIRTDSGDKRTQEAPVSSPAAAVPEPAATSVINQEMKTEKEEPTAPVSPKLVDFKPTSPIYDATMDDEDLIIKHGVENYKILVKTYVFTERGNQVEKLVINRINEQEGLKFIEDTELKTKDFGLYKICGRVDGIDRDRGCVIEVKSRNYTNGFNPTLSFRERLQCMTYMNLTQMHRCYLVESNSVGQQKVTVIEYDEEEFEDLIAKHLRLLVLKYRAMSEEEFIRKVEKYPIV